MNNHPANPRQRRFPRLCKVRFLAGALVLCICLVTACLPYVDQPPRELEDPGVWKGDGLYDKGFLVNWQEVFPDCSERTSPRNFMQADTVGDQYGCL